MKNILAGGKNMRHLLLILNFLTLGVLLSAQEVTAFRDGDQLWVQSRYTDEQDIIIHVFRYANQGARLVPRKSDIRDYQKGKLLHIGGDDYAVTEFSGYGLLSGNHGSPFGRIVLSPGHGFSDRDLGSEIKDETGNSYRLMQVIDRNRFLIHPENRGQIGEPSFAAFRQGKLFSNGQEIKYEKTSFAMLRPLNRILRQEFLIDGAKPMPEKEVIHCQFIEQIFIHDVVAPESLVEYLKAHPGKKPFPEFTSQWSMVKMTDDPRLLDYGRLPALATIANRIAFQDRGAVTIRRKTTFHVAMKRVQQREVMFGWDGLIAKGNREEIFIPKLKPMKVKGITGNNSVSECDFASVCRLPEKVRMNQMIRKNHAVNPADLPDRFMMFNGQGRREYGIVLGYSLFSGCTAKKNQGANRPNLYFLWNTKKMYPYCYAVNNITPGTSIESLSYRQYINPSEDPDATAFYFHRQENSDVVYFDCHKPLKNKYLKLPSYMTGKKITVLEQSPRVKLHTVTIVPPEGIRFDVTGNSGSLVLKLDAVSPEKKLHGEK